MDEYDGQAFCQALVSQGREAINRDPQTAVSSSPFAEIRRYGSIATYGLGSADSILFYGREAASELGIRIRRAKTRTR